MDQLLLTALQQLSRVKVPPPNLCDNPGSLEKFFETFERYALATYGDDKISWLQILPSFLKGEPLQICNALGDSLEYEELRDRMIDEFAVPAGITSQIFTRLLEAKIMDGESLKCFGIRLEGLADKIPSDDAGKRALMLSAFRANLPDDVNKQLDLQLDMNTVTFREVLSKAETFKNVLRGSFGAASSDSARPFTIKKEQVMIANSSDAGLDKPVKELKYISKSVTCFGCRQEGHVVKDCPSKEKQNGVSCYSCGKLGHVARNCWNPRSFKPDKEERENRTCHLCGKVGHLKRDCRSTVGTKDRVICGFCGYVGHPMKNCREWLSLNESDILNTREKSATN